MHIIFDENDKLNSPKDCYHVVKAKILNEEEERELYNVVVGHIIYILCGRVNLNSPRMKHCSYKTTKKKEKEKENNYLK